MRHTNSEVFLHRYEVEQLVACLERERYRIIRLLETHDITDRDQPDDDLLDELNDTNLLLSRLMLELEDRTYFDDVWRGIQDAERTINPAKGDEDADN